MLIRNPHLCTVMDIWQPKFNDKSLTKKYGEAVALMHKGKVDNASPLIIVTFSKSPHLAGQRFAINRLRAQSHAVGTNGKAPMYEVPMSHFEPYETIDDIKNTVQEFGW